MSSPGRGLLSSSPGKRKEMDIMKLMMSDYNVEMEGDSTTEFYVTFIGPKGTPYEGGKWRIHVELPDQYPYRSPSIGFVNRIFHPNVDERSGTVCLDVLNTTWTPMYDLINVFEVFLPQLLSYPNPSDPLNGDAASLMARDPERYSAKVKEYVTKYASGEPPKDASSSASSAAGKGSSSAALDEDEDDTLSHASDDGEEDDLGLTL